LSTGSALNAVKARNRIYLTHSALLGMWG